LACGLWSYLGVAAPALAGSGGAFANDVPRVTSVSCVAGCASVDSAQPGSVLRIRGKALKQVAKVVFLGGPGWRDNATAAVIRARLKSVDVTLPENALSGRLRAVGADGLRSRPSRAIVSVQRGEGSTAALEVRVIGRRVFHDAARPARVDLLAPEALAVTVALVRVSDGAAVLSWPVSLAAGVVQSLTWDGTVAGLPQPAGRYEFRVFGQTAEVQAAEVAPVAAPMASALFDLIDHKFPIRGRHDFGEEQAQFGAGRSGHSHQGQDIFAPCGSTLVAARGGVVKLNKQHDAAGNYIVIDGEGTDVDYAYMHMRDPSPLEKGARVLTGEVVGYVGDTGHAFGCHLHFEMWGAPGWYTGGSPIDPLPFLKAWDAYS